MVIFSCLAVSKTSVVRWPLNSSSRRRMGSVLKEKLNLIQFAMMGPVNYALALAQPLGATASLKSVQTREPFFCEASAVVGVCLKTIDGFFFRPDELASNMTDTRSLSSQTHLTQTVFEPQTPAVVLGIISTHLPVHSDRRQWKIESFFESSLWTHRKGEKSKIHLSN